MVDRIRQHITFLGSQAGASLLKPSLRILVVRILPLTTGGLWGRAVLGPGASGLESALPYSCPSKAPLTPAVFSSCNSQSSLAWSACSKGANGLCSPSEGHHQSPSCP